MEIMSLHSDSDSEEMAVTSHATITGINKQAGWYYISCNICSKKLQNVPEGFYCNNCKSKSEFPKPRYRQEVYVEDETASTTFTIFNQLVEKILQVPVTDLYMQKTMGENEEDLPNKLKTVIGKSYIFQLKLNSFNLRHGRENYTVTSIVPLNSPIQNQQLHPTEKKDGKQVIEDIKCLSPSKESTSSISHDQRQEDYNCNRNEQEDQKMDRPPKRLRGTKKANNVEHK